MRSSYRANRAAWDALLQRERVTLCCYCTDPARCHRVVLARILVRLGATYEGEAGHARDEHDVQELEQWLRETFGDDVQLVRVCEVGRG